jgi:hypothetical protein
MTEIQLMSTSGASDESVRTDSAEQVTDDNAMASRPEDLISDGGRTADAKARGEREKLLAELDQIEQQTFEEYLQTARRDGGSLCIVTQGYIELSRRIWQNAHKALRDVRERM